MSDSFDKKNGKKVREQYFRSQRLKSKKKRAQPLKEPNE